MRAAGPPVEILAAEPEPPRGPDEVVLSQATPAAQEGEQDSATPHRSAGTAIPGVPTDSSLKGFAAAVPAIVTEELSASGARFCVLMSAAKLCPPPVVAKPSNNRQTPFIRVQAIFMFFPLGLMVSGIRVLPVVREVRTIPFVTNRTVVATGIRIGLREVVLGVWGDIFRKTILGKAVTICGKDGALRPIARIRNPQITQIYANTVGRLCDPSRKSGHSKVHPAIRRTVSCGLSPVAGDLGRVARRPPRLLK